MSAPLCRTLDPLSFVFFSLFEKMMLLWRMISLLGLLGFSQVALGSRNSLDCGNDGIEVTIWIPPTCPPPLPPPPPPRPPPSPPATATLLLSLGVLASCCCCLYCVAMAEGTRSEDLREEEEEEEDLEQPPLRRRRRRRPPPPRQHVTTTGDCRRHCEASCEPAPTAAAIL